MLSVEDMPPPNDKEQLKARLNAETAKIAWHELQKHYAAGNVLAVEQGADLIQVAITMHQDDRAQIETWLTGGVIAEVSDAQAQAWYSSDSILWAIVLPPFVLVQPVADQ